MPQETANLVAFNRGIVDKRALARVDLNRLRLSAEEQTNLIPRTVGSMTLRPGLEYISPTTGNSYAIHIPFIFATEDTALVELTPSTMRVRVDEHKIARPAVTTVVTNGTFDTDLSGWDDADEPGATSTWFTGGLMSLTGTRYNAAIRRQQVSVTGANLNVEHGLRVIVARGPVTLRVGSTVGADDYIRETMLGTGVHSLSVTPGTDLYVQLSNKRQAMALVDSVTIEAPGEVSFPTPWAIGDLPFVRWDQSGDVIFVACRGLLPRRIERRATRSWSIATYEPENGPFRIENVTTTQLTPSAITGDITLTATDPLFRQGHVGALFKLRSVGQRVEASLNGDGQFSGEIKVTGVGTTRRFDIAISGTWSGTLTLQRSIAEPGSWVAVNTYTSNATTNYNDELDNQTVYYRIGFETGGYVSGTADIVITYPGGSITGIVRITSVSSDTVASAAVLTALGGTAASETWSEGSWSDYRGWPSSVALYEGRLWWSGKDGIWGSISDAYDSFDESVEGDSGPINRTIGTGPVDMINWMLPMQRLLIGTDGAEMSARSTSFDEPLTPSNFNLKAASTQGSARVAAVKIDGGGMFVQRSGVRLFSLSYDVQANDYASKDMTILAPRIGEPGIVRLAVQRQPDTRVHCVRGDGKVALLIFDKAEEVECWVLVETDGAVEDVVILPGALEDRVYYAVRRTIGGNTVRYLERWALESECTPGAVVKLADSCVVYDGAPTTTIAVPHLDGEEVVCWANGRDRGHFTVTDGAISLPEAVDKAVVGLPYAGRFKSAKLFHGGAFSTSLNQRKRISQIGLLLADTHARALRYGQDYEHLRSMPEMEGYKPVDPHASWDTYDKDTLAFPGSWDTDARVCLVAEAPRPVTVMGLTLSLQANDKV